MAITRAGVYYDLSKSHHRLKLGEYTLVFSSQLHLNKFKNQYEDHRRKINESLSKRFNLLVDVSTLADIVLYKRIETRGFLIVCKDGTLSCVSNTKFESGKVTLKK